MTIIIIIATVWRFYICQDLATLKSAVIFRGSNLYEIRDTNRQRIEYHGIVQIIFNPYSRKFSR